jgi:hypothetical protein
MTTTDSNGFTLDDYPERVHNARLLGINGEGLAEYLKGDEVISAKIDESGSLQLPAPEFGIAHELSLTEYEFDLSTYLRTAAEENGEWRVLSSFAQQHYTQSGSKRSGGRR